MGENGYLIARLISRQELAPEVDQFDFEVPDKEFLFTPGQFVSVVENANGSEKTRAYSIASARNGSRFSLCLNRVPDGTVSNKLFSLRRGDEISIHEPLGYFTLRHPGRRLVFVCTGTGIAPFRSILQDHLPRIPLHVTLLFGTRFESGLLYRSEMEKLAAQYSAFRYLPTLSRAADGWPGRTGRVRAHLDEAIALRTPEDVFETDVYICGLKEMVDDVRSELKKRGFDRKQIIYEKYD